MNRTLGVPLDKNRPIEGLRGSKEAVTSGLFFLLPMDLSVLRLIEMGRRTSLKVL